MAQKRLDHLIQLFHNAQFSLFDSEAALLLETDPPLRIRAKILGWCAQSQQQQHQIQRAIAFYEKAIQVAKEAGDYDGVDAFRKEQNALKEQQKVHTPPKVQGSSPLQDGIAMLKTKTSRAETLLLSSVAQADDDGDGKAQVLSRLALARLPHYRDSMLQEAMQIAQREGDMNLVTAVKKTMDQLGISIKPHIF